MKPGPRWIHFAYAKLLGYFWLPCPICQRPFGGHEWSGKNAWDCGPRDPGTATGVCSDACGRVANLLSMSGVYYQEES